MPKEAARGESLVADDGINAGDQSMEDMGNEGFDEGEGEFPEGEEGLEEEEFSEYDDDLGQDGEEEEEPPAKRKKPENAIRALELKMERMQAQAEYFREMAYDLKRRLDGGEGRREREEDDDPFSDIEPDEPFTVEHARKMIASIEKRNARRLAEQEATHAKRLARISDSAARARYTDYDDTIKLAAALAKENPAYIDQIVSSDDPAEAAYRIGQTHPKYKRLRKSDKTRLAEKLNATAKKPRPVSAMRSSAVKRGSGEDVFDMDSAKFMEYRRKRVGV